MNRTNSSRRLSGRIEQWIRGIGRRWQLIGLALWLVEPLFRSTAAAQDYRYVVPEGDYRWAGNYDGSSAALPARFSAKTVTDWMADDNLADLRVEFLVPESAAPANGARSINPSLVYKLGGPAKSSDDQRLIIWSTNPNKQIVLERHLFPDQFADLTPRPVLQMQRQPDSVIGSRWAQDSPLHDWMIRCYKQDNASRPHYKETCYLEQFRIKDLVLDGNFDQMGAFASEANATGFKLMALDVWAKLGRYENILVKNFGVVGAVPRTIYSVAGTEAFPVRFTTFDDGQVLTRNAAGVVVDSTGDPVDAFPQVAWVLDRVDISNFHTLHGGYTTLIMAQVLTASSDVPATRNLSTLSPLALVRNCQIQGNDQTIAFGCAGRSDVPTSDGNSRAGQFRAGRVIFAHNVVLNAGIISNTDTKQLGPFQLFNNVFLDSARLAAFGQTYANAVANQHAGHANLLISGNVIRFRGHKNVPSYDDFCLTTTSWPPTAPNSALGRLEGRFTAGLVVQGYAQGISIGNNRITTWPQATFDADGWGTWFRPIYVLPSASVECGLPAGTRYSAQDVTLWNNLYSGRALDFTHQNIVANSAPHQNAFPGDPAATSAFPGAPGSTPTPQQNDQGAGLTWPRQALASAHLGFVPAGKVERVIRRRYESSGNLQDTSRYALLGVVEVMLGQPSMVPTINPTHLKVPVRAVDHLLPYLGGSQTGTRGIRTETVGDELRGKIYLQLELDTVTAQGTVQNVTYSPLGANGADLMMDLPADFSGKADFLIPVSHFPALQNPHAACRIKAWIDRTPGLPTSGLESLADADDAGVAGAHAFVDQTAGSPTVAGAPEAVEIPATIGGITADPSLQTDQVLDEDVDAWASCTFAKGTVVSLTASPDVADDKNTTASTKWAKFVIKRSNGTAGDLSVNVTVLGANQQPLVRPTDGSSLHATYGTSGSADYYLTGGGVTWPTGSSVTLPFTVTVTIPDTLPQVELTVRPRPDNLTEQNVVTLELAANPVPTAYVIDAAAKRATVLIFDGPEFTLQELSGTSAPAYNAAFVTGVNDGVKNANGTWAVLPQIVGTAVNVDGTGIANQGVLWNPGSAVPAVNFGNNFVPGGISFRSTSTGNNMVAGYTATEAKASFYGGSVWNTQTLPPPLSGGGVTGAMGVSRNGQWEVGFSTVSGKKKPLVWPGLGFPLDLLGTGYSAADGEAKAINDSRVVVGAVTGRFSTSSAKRAFRTPGGTLVVLADADDLWPPESVTSDQETSTVSVNASGQAVGTFKFNSSAYSAAFWAARSGNLNPKATDLGVWQSPVGSGVYDFQSFALGINDQGRIVGRSRSAGGVDRAVLRYSSSGEDLWKDLNDRHFVHGTTGWVLQSATAINNTGYIVGNGTLNGASRGFVLIPRTPGN